MWWHFSDWLTSLHWDLRSTRAHIEQEVILHCCWWWSCWQHFVTDLEAEVKKLTFFSNIEHNVWWKFWSWNSDKIWSWSLLSFLCWCFVEVMLNPSRILVDILKQGLGKILKLKFYGEAMFGSDFEVDAWSRFSRWNLIKICVWTCDINSTLGSVVPLAMFNIEFLQGNHRTYVTLPKVPCKNEQIDVNVDVDKKTKSRNDISFIGKKR